MSGQQVHQTARILIIALWIAATRTSSALNTGAPADDLQQYQQRGATVTAITPIFNQLVEFTVPPHFKGVFQKLIRDFYIQESVLDGETVDQWSQMITLTGKQGTAADPQASPRALLVNIAGGLQRACPSSFAILELGPKKIDGYDGFAGIASCGSVGTGDAAHSETAMILAVKGSADFYTIQWAQRGTASDHPLAPDSATWVNRFKQLDPIRLCALIAGEAAPYPSCVGRSGR
jgi:hypothetical protein